MLRGLQQEAQGLHELAHEALGPGHSRGPPRRPRRKGLPGPARHHGGRPSSVKFVLPRRQGWALGFRVVSVDNRAAQCPRVLEPPFALSGHLRVATSVVSLGLLLFLLLCFIFLRRLELQPPVGEIR